MAVFHFAPVWTASRFATSGKKRRGIKDVAAAALQGAQIVLQPTATTAVSDAQGSFVIPNVKPGAYAVKVSYVGFTNSVTSVVLNSGQATPVNATMSVASANQQAEVTADLVGDAAAINE